MSTLFPQRPETEARLLRFQNAEVQGDQSHLEAALQNEQSEKKDSQSAVRERQNAIQGANGPEALMSQLLGLHGAQASRAERDLQPEQSNVRQSMENVARIQQELSQKAQKQTQEKLAQNKSADDFTNITKDLMTAGQAPDAHTEVRTASVDTSAAAVVGAKEVVNQRAQESVAQEQAQKATVQERPGETPRAA